MTLVVPQKPIVSRRYLYSIERKLTHGSYGGALEAEMHTLQEACKQTFASLLMLSRCPSGTIGFTGILMVGLWAHGR